MAYVDRNRYIPFNAESRIWDREPARVNATTHRIVLQTIDKVGVDEMHKYFKKLTFGEYNG